MYIRYLDVGDTETPPEFAKECHYPHTIRGSRICMVRVYPEDSLTDKQFKDRVAWYYREIAPCIRQGEST